MSTSNLIRWSGLAALVGGVLGVVLDVVDGVLIGGQPDSVAAATNAWIIINALWILLLALISLGLVGAYARQAEQAGTLGLIGFLAAFIGTAMMSGAIWSAAFIAPWLAEAAPELVGAEPSGVVVAGFLLTVVLFGLGWLLFGLASLQARVLPRGVAVLLMIGAVLGSVLEFLELPFSGVVISAAVAWMGYAVWTGTHEKFGQPEPGS